MALIRTCIYIHFFVYLTFVPLVAQETAVAKLYLITGIVVEGIIEEVTSETVRFNFISDDGFHLIQKVPIRMIYKLILPSGEEIIHNPDFADAFEKNLVQQDSIKQAAQIENDYAELNNAQRGGLNVGIGFSSLGFSSVGADFNFMITDRLISQISWNHDVSFELGGGTPETVTSSALLAGVIAKGEYFMTAILAGVGMVEGFHQGRFLGCNESGGFICGGIYEKISFTTIGLVGNIQFYWMPVSSFGIGATITGNINSETPFMNFRLSLRLGS